jgi:CMP-N-acetylneuraminic acid synthetase
MRLRNVRPLGDAPLIAHAVRAAVDSKLDRIVVSTDQSSIANIARSYGAEAPFLRPAELANSKTVAVDIVRHTLDWVKHEDGYRPDAICYLSPSIPFRQGKRITEACRLLKPHVDSVLSISGVSQHPYQMFESDATGRMREYLQMKKKPQRQRDLPTLFCSSKFVAVTQTNYFEEHTLGAVPIVNLRNFKPFHITDEEGFEIKSTFDLELAELAHEGRGPAPVTQIPQIRSAS